MEWFKRLFKRETEVKCEETVIEEVTEKVKTYQTTEDGHYLIDYNKVQTIDDIKLLLKFAIEKVFVNHFRVEYIEHLIAEDDWKIGRYNFSVSMYENLIAIKENLETLKAIASQYKDRETLEQESESLLPN